MTSLIMVACLAIVGTACAWFVDQNPDLILEFQLKGKNLVSPENDALNDLSIGKLNCYSTTGYARHFPGLETEQEYSICRGAEEIEFWGYSCIIVSDEHERASQKANNYAARYNRYVVSNYHEKV